MTVHSYAPLFTHKYSIESTNVREMRVGLAVVHYTLIVNLENWEKRSESNSTVALGRLVVKTRDEWNLFKTVSTGLLWYKPC